jgi:hypothetical protein
MEERHYVGVYWEDREVTKAECVPPILDLIARLSAHDALLSRWFVLRPTREESLAAELTGPAAPVLLEAGIAPAVENEPTFGWRLVLWNGEADARSARLELDLGGHMHSHVSPTPNACILRMPRRAAAEALLRRPSMTALLIELATVWHADWGVASTDAFLLRGPSGRPSHHPRVGWLTFLNAWRGRAPKLPQAHVTPAGSLGYVVATEDEEFTIDDGRATVRVEDVELALERAKRLDPRGARPAAAPSTTDPAPPAALGAGAVGYAAAVDAACAVDALTSRLPARRADLAESLLRASTALAVAVSTGDDGARPAAELRVLLDLAERLFPDAATTEVARVREALERIG